MAWTDEEKEQAISAYKEAEPTPETSTEIVKAIAEEMEKSPNGVRMILSKAGVYVKQTPAEAGSTPKSNGGGGRVSKAQAHEELVAQLNDVGAEVNEDIVSKLTGKAAQYFTEVLKKVS